MDHQGYYNELRRTYGHGFVEDIKHWKKLGINLEKIKLQRIFLFNCRASNVIPQHILNNCYINIRCFSKGVQTKIENSIQLFSKKILEHEITDIIQEIQHLHKNVIFLKEKLLTFQQ